MVIRTTRTRLVDTVAEQLRERILSGRIVAGQRLRQATLAAEFNVSRTPLREALRRLEEQGLVAVSPTQGVQVVEPDRERLLAAYELREVLDGLSARLATERAGAALRRSLLRALEVQRTALEPWDSRLWTEGNVSFHGAVTEAAGNPFLVQLLPVMRMTAQMFYPQMLLNRERTGDAYAEHQAIYDAIERGDPESAEREARHHIRTTAEQLRHRVAHEAANRGHATDGRATDGPAPTPRRRRRVQA